METKRQQKFSRLLQRDLGDILQKDAKNLFGNAFVTVTAVRMSPDLSIAKVYLSILMSDKQDEFMELIHSKKGIVKKLLTQRIGKQVRIIPDLHFYLDDSAEYSSRINQILDNLHIPPEEED